MRAFFALWPDAETRARVAVAGEALRLTVEGRPVPRENLHVTLAFVGEATRSQLVQLQQIGRGQWGRGCTIGFDAYDYWPESQVVVAVARETPPALIGLWRRLQEALALHPAIRNLSHPQPSLRTHVTLARKVVQAPVLQAMSPLHWSARSFCLVRSDTSGVRSVYTVVDTWPLLDETQRS